jgi:hypothetical protein
MNEIIAKEVDFNEVHLLTKPSFFSSRKDINLVRTFNKLNNFK